MNLGPRFTAPDSATQESFVRREAVTDVVGHDDPNRPTKSDVGPSAARDLVGENMKELVWAARMVLADVRLDRGRRVVGLVWCQLHRVSLLNDVRHSGGEQSLREGSVSGQAGPRSGILAESRRCETFGGKRCRRIGPLQPS